MSLPNKYYQTVQILESINSVGSISALKFMLLNGGIDEIIKWCTRASYAFEHDLDNSTMTIFGGEGDNRFFLKLKVMEFEPGFGNKNPQLTAVEIKHQACKIIIPDYFFEDDEHETESDLHKKIWAECQEEMIGRLETLKYDTETNPANKVHNTAIMQAQNQIRI